MTDAAPPRQWLDIGGYSTLAMCSCGWRQLIIGTDRPIGWATVYAHAVHAHRGEIARETARNVSHYRLAGRVSAVTADTLAPRADSGTTRVHRTPSPPGLSGDTPGHAGRGNT